MPCTRGVHRWINDRASSMLLVVCMVTLALVPVHAARAALWVEITVEPKTPRAGEVATINVQTFSFVQTRCIDDPAAHPIPAVAYTGETYPTVLDTFEVTATAPDGEEHLVLLERTKEDGSIWEGETVFPVPGAWSLEMTMPYWPPHTPVPDPCSGSSIVFTVHAPDHVTPLATPCGTSVASPAP